MSGNKFRYLWVPCQANMKKDQIFLFIYLSFFHFYILGVIKRNVSLRERWWHVVEEAKNWLALHFWKVSTFWSAGNRFLGDTAQHLRHSVFVCVLSLPLLFFWSFLIHQNCICLSYSLVSYGCSKLQFNLNLNSIYYTLYYFHYCWNYVICKRQTKSCKSLRT